MTSSEISAAAIAQMRERMTGYLIDRKVPRADAERVVAGGVFHTASGQILAVFGAVRAVDTMESLATAAEQLAASMHAERRAADHIAHKRATVRGAL